MEAFSYTLPKPSEACMHSASLNRRNVKIQGKQGETKESALSQESQGERCAVSQTLRQDCFTLPLLSPGQKPGFQRRPVFQVIEKIG